MQQNGAWYILDIIGILITDSCKQSFRVVDSQSGADFNDFIYTIGQVCLFVAKIFFWFFLYSKVLYVKSYSAK